MNKQEHEELRLLKEYNRYLNTEGTARLTELLGKEDIERKAQKNKGLIHFRKNIWVDGKKEWYQGRSLCHRSRYKTPILIHTPNMLLTKNDTKVTCKNCLAKLNEGSDPV